MLQYGSLHGEGRQPPGLKIEGKTRCRGHTLVETQKAHAISEFVLVLTKFRSPSPSVTATTSVEFTFASECPTSATSPATATTVDPSLAKCVGLVIT